MAKIIHCFKGATTFELQIGGLWLKLIRPRYFHWSNILHKDWNK